MLAHGVSAEKWNRVLNRVNPFLPARLRTRGGGEKFHKLADALAARSPDELYRSLVSQWQDPAKVLLIGRELGTVADRCDSISGLHFFERMMYYDLMSYLPGDILTKIDRASMAVSLETRVVYLDNDVMRFAWSLPLSTKLNNGVGKWPLRQLLKRFMPTSLFDRPKTGFGIPIGDWLRGPLKGWAEELLSPARIEQSGCFRSEVVRECWDLHLSRRRNMQHALWSVLMFQAWYEQYLCSPLPPPVSAGTKEIFSSKR